jgi:hypothetical protein
MLSSSVGAAQRSIWLEPTHDTSPAVNELVSIVTVQLWLGISSGTSNYFQSPRSPGTGSLSVG